MIMMMKIIGMTNTGKMNTGMMATGFIIHMDTIVSIMYGGIHGGGIGIGTGAIGSITSAGISFTVDSMLCGIIMAAGGTGQDMVAM